MTICEATLNDVVEFDVPFEVIHASDDSGTVVRSPLSTHDYFPPDVWDEWYGSGVFVSNTRWKLLCGYSGQYGYRGPVMHPSEYLAGDLARDVLSNPGVYVIVEVRDETGAYPDYPIGWVILRWEERSNDGQAC